MDDLDLPTLLEALKARFDRDCIYTYVGEILVSVNPFKMIDVSLVTFLSFFISFAESLAAQLEAHHVRNTQIPETSCVSA